jgi:hypothetical protein
VAPTAAVTLQQHLLRAAAGIRALPFDPSRRVQDVWATGALTADQRSSAQPAKQDPSARSATRSGRSSTTSIAARRADPLSAARQPRWWAQAFEAAGYRNAFRVELMPEGADPLDIRYNVIQWLHTPRAAELRHRIRDPRTGGSSRAGLARLAARRRTTCSPRPAVAVSHPTRFRLAWMVLARLRQLAAFVGHARLRPQLLRQHRRPDLGDGLPASARTLKADGIDLTDACAVSM